MENHNEPGYIKRHLPMIIGLLITLAVFGFFGFAMIQPICFGQTPEAQECFSKWTYLQNAPPNEIGDAISGFAGILAFVWIIVTVWLQSQELRAQREELKLTRTEMHEQRKATQDMARSMAAQAAIFEDEKTMRDEDKSRRNLESLLHRTENQIRELFRRDEQVKWLFDASDYYSMSIKGAGKAWNKYDSVTDVDSFFVTLYRNLFGRLYPKDAQGSHPFKGSSNLNGVESVLTLLNDIEEVLPSAPLDQVNRLHGIFFSETCQFLRIYISTPNEFPSLFQPIVSRVSP